MRDNPLSRRTLAAGLKGPAAGEIRALVRRAEKEGWHVWLTSRNHVGFRPPGPGRPVFAPLTGRSSHAARRLRAALRRGGLEV